MDQVVHLTASAKRDAVPGPAAKRGNPASTRTHNPNDHWRGHHPCTEPTSQRPSSAAPCLLTQKRERKKRVITKESDKRKRNGKCGFDLCERSSSVGCATQTANLRSPFSHLPVELTKGNPLSGGVKRTTPHDLARPNGRLVAGWGRGTCGNLGPSDCSYKLNFTCSHGHRF